MSAGSPELFLNTPLSAFNHNTFPAFGIWALIVATRRQANNASDGLFIKNGFGILRDKENVRTMIWVE